MQKFYHTCSLFPKLHEFNFIIMLFDYSYRWRHRVSSIHLQSGFFQLLFSRCFFAFRCRSSKIRSVIFRSGSYKSSALIRSKLSCCRKASTPFVNWNLAASCGSIIFSDSCLAYSPIYFLILKLSLFLLFWLLLF